MLLLEPFQLILLRSIALLTKQLLTEDCYGYYLKIRLKKIIINQGLHLLTDLRYLILVTYHPDQ